MPNTNPKLKLILPAIFACAFFALAGRAGAATNLRVSANGRWIENRMTGAGVFLIADSAWAIHKLSQSAQDSYFTNRSAKKINAFYMSLAATWIGANYQGQRPFTTSNDCLAWNASYFQYVKDIANKANSYGFYVFLEMGEPLNPDEVFYVGANNTTKARQWGERVGDYFRDSPNVIFTLGEDSDADKAGLAVHRAAAEGLARGVTGNTVAYNQSSLSWNEVFITYHPGGSSNLLCSSDWFHNDPWLDLNSVQLYSDYLVDDIYSRVNFDYNLIPVKPTWLIEGPYENRTAQVPDGDPVVSDYWVRYETYNAVFAGGCAGTYGHNSLFWFGAGWTDLLNTAGANDMPHLHSLIVNNGSRPFRELQPYQSAIASSIGSGFELRSCLRASSGNFLYCYLPRGGAVTINMSSLSNAVVNAQWFNPRDGIYSSIGSYANSGTRTFTSPGSYIKGNDYVLVLQAAPDTTSPAVPSGLAVR